MIGSLKGSVRSIHQDSRGQVAVEQVVLVGLVAVAGLAAMFDLGGGFSTAIARDAAPGAGAHGAMVAAMEAGTDSLKVPETAGLAVATGEAVLAPKTTLPTKDGEVHGIDDALQAIIHRGWIFTPAAPHFYSTQEIGAFYRRAAQGFLGVFGGLAKSVFTIGRGAVRTVQEVLDVGVKEYVNAHPALTNPSAWRDGAINLAKGLWHHYADTTANCLWGKDTASAGESCGALGGEVASVWLSAKASKWIKRTTTSLRDLRVVRAAAKEQLAASKAAQELVALSEAQKQAVVLEQAGRIVSSRVSRLKPLVEVADGAQIAHLDEWTEALAYSHGSERLINSKARIVFHETAPAGAKAGVVYDSAMGFRKVGASLHVYLDRFGGAPTQQGIHALASAVEELVPAPLSGVVSAGKLGFRVPERFRSAP